MLKEDPSISWTETVYQEEASYTVNYAIEKGHAVFVGLGYMFSKAAGIEVDLDLASRNLAADSRVLVPHPLHFDSPRAANDSMHGGLTETALSVGLLGSIPLGGIELDLWAGPAVFLASAELISALPFTESDYPYDTVSVDSQTEKLKKNVFGLSAGTSLNVRLIKGVALSISARYLLAKAGFQPSSGIPRLDLTLGGLRLSGGLKVGF